MSEQYVVAVPFWAVDVTAAPGRDACRMVRSGETVWLWRRVDANTMIVRVRTRELAAVHPSSLEAL